MANDVDKDINRSMNDILRVFEARVRKIRKSLKFNFKKEKKKGKGFIILGKEYIKKKPKEEEIAKEKYLTEKDFDSTNENKEENSKEGLFNMFD